MMAKKKILIIGPIPPPFGGVSVHILRLSNLLKNDFNFDFIDESRKKKKEYSNIRSKKFLPYLKKIRNADLLYIHSGKNILRIIHLLIGKFFLKKVIITIHSYPAPPKLIGYIIGFIYRMANAVIIVNSETKTRLLLPESKCILKEAFIPPVFENESELPSYIFDWLSKNKKEDAPIICANASKLITYNNDDLYGLDLCIEVTKRLIEKGIPIKFIFVVASTDKNRKQYLKNQALIKVLRLEGNFLLINERLSFVKVIQLSDIILRPTNTDGDALTIREGLFLKKPVLASDVVKRPMNVFLFKNRNIDDLESQLKNLIQLIRSPHYHAVPWVESHNDLKEFYLQLIKNTFLQKNYNERQRFKFIQQP